MDIRHLVLLLSLSVASLSDAKNLTCSDVHQKALSTCRAHENTASPSDLTIVSSQTRDRVVSQEEVRLRGFKQSCLRAQDSCAITCDEEIETASLTGLDMGPPLEHLNDCRQGEVAKQLKFMERKLGAYKKLRAAQPMTKRGFRNAANP